MGERREAHPAPLVGSEALNPSDKGAVVKLPRRRFLKARMCCCGRLGATAAGAGARLTDPAGALRGRLSAHASSSTSYQLTKTKRCYAPLATSELITRMT
jgi:hypothetical protein